MITFTLLLSIPIVAAPSFPLKTVKLVNEENKNKTLPSFTKKLKNIIRKKEWRSLKKLLDQNVRFSFGLPAGITGFSKFWQLNKNPKNSKVWKKLKRVMSLGGSFIDEEYTFFTAPYVFNKFNNVYDPYTHSVIVGKKVNIRKSPSTYSKVIENLSYAVVRNVKQKKENIVFKLISGEIYPWKKIITPSGKIGFIYGKFLYSPLNYRIGIKKVDEEWKIVYFIKGD